MELLTARNGNRIGYFVDGVASSVFVTDDLGNLDYLSFPSELTRYFLHFLRVSRYRVSRDLCFPLSPRHT